MGEYLSEAAQKCEKIDELFDGLPSNLKKMFKLSQPFMLSCLLFSPEIVTGVGMAYIAADGIINHIENQNMVKALKEYVERRIDEKINVDNTEEIELIKIAILKSLRSSKDAQIKRIMDVVQATIEGKRISCNQAEDFINVISELSERGAILLVNSYKYFDSHMSPKFTVSNVEAFGDLSKDSYAYLLNRLEGKGLLQSESTTASGDDINGLFAGKSPENMQGDDEEEYLVANRKTYYPTDFGRRLFQSLHSEEYGEVE